MLVVSALAGVVAWIPFNNAVPGEVAGVLVVTMALTAVGGAAISVLMGAPGPVDQVSMVIPEFAGMRTVLRTVWPPALAVLGALPVVAAERGGHPSREHRQPRFRRHRGDGAPPRAVWSGRWGVRFREELHLWWRQVMESASPTAQAERAAAARAAADDDDDEDHA